MPIVLVNNRDVPQAITIDLDTKRIYYSTKYPSEVRIDIISRKIYFEDHI